MSAYDTFLAAIQPEPWMTDALCLEVGVELFFAEGQGNSLREARRICERCPVQLECLSYAMRTGEVDTGMFGGLNPRQRRKYKAQLKREAS